MPLGEENATRYKIVLYHSEAGYSVFLSWSAGRKAKPLPSYPIVVGNPEQAWTKKIDSKGVLG